MNPLIKEMVDRFLSWNLPGDFNPDCGISFAPEFNAEYNKSKGLPPDRHEPTGTNLFDAGQARQMIEYVIGPENIAALEAHKRITESAEVPEPVAWMAHGGEIWNTPVSPYKDERGQPLYGPDLLAYADRMRAERDAFEKKYQGLLTRLNPDIEYVEHVAVGYGADEIDRLRSQLAELQAKNKALDAEIAKIEAVVCLLPEFDGDEPGDCGDRIANAVKRFKAKMLSVQNDKLCSMCGESMSAVALDKGGK